MDVIASRANSVQWLVHDRELAPSAEHEWNKERVPGARNGYWITARGYSGVDQRTKTETERAIERWGISQDVNAESSIDITHTLELKIHDLSLSLAQHFLFETHCFKLNPDNARISFFLFLAVQHRSFIEPVYEANIPVTKYHQNNSFLQFTSKSDIYVFGSACYVPKRAKL
jgi:hypothetical protein